MEFSHHEEQSTRGHFLARSQLGGSTTTVFGAKDAQLSSSAPTNHMICSTSLGSWLSNAGGMVGRVHVVPNSQREWPQIQSKEGPLLPSDSVKSEIKSR